MGGQLGWSWYQRTSAAAMQGLRLRALRPVANRVQDMPAGAVFTVRGKAKGGLDVVSDRCSQCGVSVHIVGVEPSAFEVVDEARQEALGL